MSLAAVFARTIDWFIPDELLQDREMRTRARMFLFSHMFGPILGNVIPGYLLWLDPGSAKTLAVLGGSICAFWLFPFALKYTGAYVLLSFISIQNLLFAILWGCYYYGGLSSPFLPWLVTVPLLAFFYLGARVHTIVLVLSQISVSIGVFVAEFAFGGRLPHTVQLEDMQVIGTISIISASIYVSMMALYYAGILASQSEFEREVRKHLQTAAELREATAMAERASAAKAEFLAKMSHELRTPLNAVIGYSQILLEDVDLETDRQAVEDLNRIHSAGHSLLGLVNSILDLSKIEAGKMEVFPESIAVSSLLGRVADRWRLNNRANGKQISLSVDDKIGAVTTDIAKTEQILDALIDNAVRYAPTGDIEIVARPQKTREGAEFVEIAIADRGPGIPRELLPTLFETFNDVDDASASKYGGAGLGLPLCSRLSELMGAKLAIQTTSRFGTTVTVSIPPPQAGVVDGAAGRAEFAKAA